MKFATALNHVSVPLSIKLLGVAALLWLSAQPATAQDTAVPGDKPDTCFSSPTLAYG